MTELSVLIPTVGGRDELLAKVRAAIEREHPYAEIVTCHGHSWGAGLNHLLTTKAGGNPVATGRYLLTCCDDTVPQPGFFEPARARTDNGEMAVQRYFELDGSPTNSEFDEAPDGTPLPWSRGYLLTREIYETVGPFIDATWYADFDYSERLLAAGVPLVATDGYRFTHLNGERSWLTPQEDGRQRAVYAQSQLSRLE